MDETVDAAEEIYISTTRPMYKDLIEWNMYSDIAQATADGVYATAGVDPLNAPGHLASVIATMANIPIQEVAALRTGGRQQDIDYASVGYQSALQKADNKLTINQALQGVGTVKREQLGNALESIDNALAMSQAVAQRASLLREVDRITAARDSSSATIRKSYYADPIHYVRSDNALILADAAFRNAQRWVFYAQRALEYKWQQRFSASENSAQGVRSFDSGTLFKLRNAAELDDLLTQLKNWNDVRLIEDTRSIRTTFVSLLDDVLAPNPNANNLTPALRVDPGVRFDALTGNTVTKREYFRRLLDRARDPNGNIVINIDTVQLAGLDGSFFIPPNYSTTPLSPGEWRDKIVYLKVNIIADDGDFSDPKSKPGSLTYGGQMFFRTRIPPCPLSPGVTSTNDLPGEFFTAPFRYYSSANFDNAFTYQSSQTQNIPIAYTDRSAVTSTGDEILGPSFQINNFNQRSVATTELALTIFASANLDVSKIRDIELIVRHSSSARLAPICP